MTALRPSRIEVVWDDLGQSARLVVHFEPEEIGRLDRQPDGWWRVELEDGTIRQRETAMEALACRLWGAP